MTVRTREDGAIALEGCCDSADAEALLQQLLAFPTSAVDWSTCESAHSAVVQVLMASGRALLGAPAGAQLRAWLHPLLTVSESRANSAAVTGSQE